MSEIGEGKGLTKIHEQLPSGLGLNDVIVACLVRNGAEYLPSFLDYYNRLGIAHFVFIVNNATDSTLDILAGVNQNKITVYSSSLPYKSHNLLFKQFLVDEYAAKCWMLLVDIDEFFDYPYSHVVNLGQFISYLNDHQYTAVLTQMLDLFSDKEIGRASHTKDQSLFEAYPFYELSSIEKRKYDIDCNRVSNDKLMLHYGGIRNRVFKVGRITLFKHALINSREGNIRLLGSHTACNTYLADISGVLYHFKFINSFIKRVKEAVALENYWNNSADYKAIEQVLLNNNDITLVTPGSERFHHISELVASGFLSISDEYERWVQSKIGIQAVWRSGS